MSNSIKDISSSTSITPPIAVELDTQTWNNHLDNTESWFDNVLMNQIEFRKFTEDTLKKINEIHLKIYLKEILESAKDHEKKIERLYHAIGRDPSSSKTRNIGGTLMSKGQQLIADIEGTAGGATGGWQDLNQLLLLNVKSMSSFAVVEQLGLALGISEISDISFLIVNEKSKHHLLLQEMVLEMSTASILYKMHL
ncbi:MAG: hypothetical protein AB7U98_08040 [Candidatus Nitrosocosmicus sp.]